MYYVQRERDLTLTHNLDKHILVANKLIEGYHRDLIEDYPDWDEEENRDKVKEQIDFLTGIFTKKKKEEAKAQKLADLREFNRKKFVSF